MPRDFIINGETLVKVKGCGALGTALDPDVPQLWELGLAVEEVRIIPRFIHKDIQVDDFGPEAPANVMALLAAVEIQMTLIHYNEEILDACMTESLGGQSVNQGGGVIPAGIMPAAGTLLGNLEETGTPGNHFIRLNLLSPVLDKPWRFPASYLTGMPLEIPLGVKATAALCRWRAIPYPVPGEVTSLGGSARPAYFAELISEGTTLWDREVDED